MSELVHGFEPYFDENSKLLILGSFPSVKSRLQNFYYGNPQNAFWKILARFFGCEAPDSVQKKKEFLTKHSIALWDIVTECRIKGSADSTITDYKIADLGRVLDRCPIKKIILNGGAAYKIFVGRYGALGVPYIKLPSTSPANARRKDEEWLNELSRTFG